MTTATRPRAARNGREQELAEQLKTHRQELSDMGDLADKAEADAAELERQADALATDLERPLEAVSAEIEQRRAAAARKRQAAADLRRRAGAYAEANGVAEQEAELVRLTSERRDREAREADAEREEARLAEIKLRQEQFRDAFTTLEAIRWRLRELDPPQAAGGEAIAFGKIRQACETETAERRRGAMMASRGNPFAEFLPAMPSRRR